MSAPDVYMVHLHGTFRADGKIAFNWVILFQPTTLHVCYYSDDRNVWYHFFAPFLKEVRILH